LAKTYLD
jgi:PLD-like domain